MAAGDDAILAFRPPSLGRMRLWLTLARVWHRPSFTGLEHVDPSRPMMFVGNHTLYGVQDVPHILYELARVRGVFPRTLADRAHFAIPVWGELLTAAGCVKGTRENCMALMRAGQHVMVFPGGAREVFKRKGESYRLIWKERIGFVQLAAAYGYTITPFASLGGDDSLQILLDAGDIMKSPLGRLLRASGVAEKYLRGGEELPPLVRGVGLTWVPKPERFYVSFGRPISTRRYRRRTEDVDAMRELRSEVASSIEAQLAQLQRVRSEIVGGGAAESRVAPAWDGLVAGFETQVDRVKRRLGGASEARLGKSACRSRTIRRTDV